MTISLLPDNFDDLLAAAIRTFWASRAAGHAAQEGTRARVVHGKNLDGLLLVVSAVARHCGLPDSAILTAGALTLPGHYRPSKDWDVLIIHQERLLAALEFKSQVGSFGNNFNNRVEEALGNITDLRRAAHLGMYCPANHHQASPEQLDEVDPRPPFVGYLMLLEEHEASTKPVKLISPHFKVDPAFMGTSYASRYKLFCERLMSQRLYDAAALMLSPDDKGVAGVHHDLSEATSARNLFAQLAARLAADVLL